MSLIPKVGREKWQIRILLMGITTFLWLGVILHFVPVWWAFTTSIKPFWEVYEFPPPIFPQKPTFVAYKLIIAGLKPQWVVSIAASSTAYIGDQPLWIFLKNSFIMTAGIMAFQVSITALVGYSLSKLFSPKWSKLLFLFFIGTMFVPGGVSLIPKFLLIRTFPFATKTAPYIPFTHTRFPSINMLNTYWGIILPFAYSGFSVLLFKGFFDGIPDELINAARLDGSSEIGIFRRIILPLSKPVFAVVAYFSFNGAWNEFLWPLIVLTRSPHLYPLPVVLYNLQQVLASEAITSSPEVNKEMLEAGLGMNAVMAMGIFQSIPCFVMFIIFREQLMKGIKLRGFK